MNIPHVKILRYVLWKNTRLPNIAMRYIRFDSHQLKRVPFEMIHGSTNNKNNKHEKENNSFITYDPWKNKSLKKNLQSLNII